MTAQQGQQGPTHPATPGGSAPPPSATAVPPVTADAATQRLREDLIHPDPLLDCLVEVCRLTGRAASRASLSAGLPLGASGKARLTLELAERAAARAGMSAKLQRLALAGIDTAALPAILILKDSQACVLLGWNADHTEARVLLPETGQGSVGIGRDALASSTKRLRSRRMNRSAHMMSTTPTDRAHSVSMALLGTTRSYTFIENSGNTSAKKLTSSAAQSTSR